MAVKSLAGKVALVSGASRPQTPPQWDEHILSILRQFDGEE
jgi:hypothetical protein